MITTAQVKAAQSNIGMMESYGMISASVSGLAYGVLGRVAEAEDVTVAVDQQIARLEAEMAATGDWGFQARAEFALKTLKGLK